jgi:transcriptional regulator with XRE-family HTH domain
MDTQATRQKQTLGRELKKARIDRGWSQRQLYEAAGISRKYLSQLECGHVDPRISIMRALADALGVSLEQLYPALAPGSRVPPWLDHKR